MVTNVKRIEIGAGVSGFAFDVVRPGKSAKGMIAENFISKATVYRERERKILNRLRQNSSVRVAVR